MSVGRYELRVLLIWMAGELAAFEIDFGLFHLAAGLGAEEGAGCHGNGPCHRRRQPSYDGNLVILRSSHRGRNGNGTDKAVLGAEHELSDAPQPGDALALVLHLLVRLLGFGSG